MKLLVLRASPRPAPRPRAVLRLVASGPALPPSLPPAKAPPAAAAPIVLRRPPHARAAPRALAPPSGISAGRASHVGITGGSTRLTCVPADLNVTGQTNIADFTVLVLDAGRYT